MKNWPSFPLHQTSPFQLGQPHLRQKTPWMIGHTSSHHIRQAQVSRQSKDVSESNQSQESDRSGQCQDVFIVDRPPAAQEGRLVLRLTKSKPQKRRTPSPTSPRTSAREPSSPPPPCKRGRPSSPSPRPSPAAAPQASSTMRSEYDLAEKSPIVLRLNKQRLSKPSKKAARMFNLISN